ncbi:MAG: HAD hydrolase-like protein [Granulosicoccus sp.]|nr:HAD hydrolase-like protein [Granulosicoccus sp.]
MSIEALSNASAAIARYESIQYRLPVASFAESPSWRQNLSELTDEIDCFVLDGFGVLNIGDNAVPGAAERIKELRLAGKQLRVLTNGASRPTSVTHQKYQRWQMPFELHEVVSSRDAVAIELSHHKGLRWGFAAIGESSLDELTPVYVSLADDSNDYDQCDGFVLLGSGAWSEKRHQLMIESLERRTRPVLVANPDLVAPQAVGLSLEPGFYAHDLWDQNLVQPQFFGKPFDNAFALIRSGISSIAPSRIAMVGDTLHTDILGGAQSGWKTVLVTDHGLLKGQDVEGAIHRSGIVPDYIVSTT